MLGDAAAVPAALAVFVAGVLAEEAGGAREPQGRRDCQAAFLLRLPALPRQPRQRACVFVCLCVHACSHPTLDLQSFVPLPSFFHPSHLYVSILVGDLRIKQGERSRSGLTSE